MTGVTNKFISPEAEPSSVASHRLNDRRMSKMTCAVPVLELFDSPEIGALSECTSQVGDAQDLDAPVLEGASTGDPCSINRKSRVTMTEQKTLKLQAEGISDNARYKTVSPDATQEGQALQKVSQWKNESLAVRTEHEHSRISPSAFTRIVTISD